REFCERDLSPPLASPTGELLAGGAATEPPQPPRTVSVRKKSGARHTSQRDMGILPMHAHRLEADATQRRGRDKLIRALPGSRMVWRGDRQSAGPPLAAAPSIPVRWPRAAIVTHPRRGRKGKSVSRERTLLHAGKR